MGRYAFALVLLFSCAGFGRIAVAADTARSYTIDPAHGQLEIIGIESGGEVTAAFKKYSATVAFAPDALTTSKADVVIDMSSIDSQDKDRDAALRGPDLFDVAQFATAHFVTRSFGLSERGFSAFGTLTMHGVTKNLVVFFNFAQSDDGRDHGRHGQDQALGFRRRERQMEELSRAGRLRENQVQDPADAKKMNRLTGAPTVHVRQISGCSLHLRRCFLHAQFLCASAVFVDQIFDARARDPGERLSGAHLREQADVLVAIQYLAVDLVELQIVRRALVEGGVALRQILAESWRDRPPLLEIARGLAKAGDEFRHPLLGLLQTLLGRLLAGVGLRDCAAAPRRHGPSRIALLFHRGEVGVGRVEILLHLRKLRLQARFFPPRPADTAA